MVNQFTKAIWILNNGSKKTAIQFYFFRISKNQLNTYGSCARDQYIPGLRKNLLVNKKFWRGNMIVILILLIEEHGHRFSSRCSFIEEGSIGQRKCRQITDQRLEIQ